MKQVTAFTPIALLASLSASHAALAANQAGDYAFTASIGESGTKNDNSYGSDTTISFALQYQKSGYAAYRATAGLLTMSGRKVINPAAGTRNADALFVKIGRAHV